MLVKEQLHHIADELPSDASIEEAIEQLIFLHKLEIGLQQADAGKVIPHDEVKKRVETWLK
jgi:predicted transcriptional regulator